MRAADQRLAEAIVRSVANGEVTRGTGVLARRLVERWDAPGAPAVPAPAKQPVASVAHHEKARRAEEHGREAVKAETWAACCARSRIDHRGALACEACHHHATSTVGMEPHHLVLVERTDAPGLVMVLCHDCHTLDPTSAHRAPRAFAKNVVVPWAKAHGFELPNRKEYRDA